MFRFAPVRYFAALAVSLVPFQPALADAQPSFEAGSILCSNLDPLNETCSGITEVTRIEGDLRYAKSRRHVAVPDEMLLLETEGTARIDGAKVCGVGVTAPPRITPSYSRYADAILTVHIRKRDYKIARGDCLIYKPCGSGYHLHRLQEGVFDDKPRSLTTIFAPGDPRIARLTLRERIFGVPENVPSECEPLS